MDNYPVYPDQEEGDDSDYKRNPYAPTLTVSTLGSV